MCSILPWCIVLLSLCPFNLCSRLLTRKKKKITTHKQTLYTLMVNCKTSPFLTASGTVILKRGWKGTADSLVGDDSGELRSMSSSGESRPFTSTSACNRRYQQCYTVLCGMEILQWFNALLLYSFFYYILLLTFHASMLHNSAMV